MSRTLRRSKNGSTRSIREIAEKAKKEGGEIHWGDETALVNTFMAAAMLRRVKRQLL
jgi:hypothetical protein